MNRVIFGFAAGVSALIAYQWCTDRKRDTVSSTDIDKMNCTSSASLTNITEEPLPSGNVLNENLAQELALLREEVLKLQRERDEADLTTQGLSEQLLDETLISQDLRATNENLRIENENLLLEFNLNQIYDHELEILRTAHNDAMSAEQEEFNQLISALQLEKARLQSQIDLLSIRLIEVTTERDAVASRNDGLTEEVVDMQSQLQAALTSLNNDESHFRDRELQEFRTQLDTSAARIAELELANCCISNTTVKMEMSAKEQATAPAITPESEKPVTSQTEKEQPDLSPPLVQKALPRPERIAPKPEAPVFACSDIRYRDKEVQGYTINPGENQPNISQKKDPAPPMNLIPPLAKQEDLHKAETGDFRVIDAVGERELPESYQLMNIGVGSYGHIIGKEGKNVKAFQKAYGVKVSVSPPTGLHPKVRVSITQGNREARRTVAKKIVESLSVSVEVSLQCFSPQQTRRLWSQYFVRISKNALDEKWILHGKLGDCVRLFNEQKIRKV